MQLFISEQLIIFLGLRKIFFKRSVSLIALTTMEVGNGHSIVAAFTLQQMPKFFI